ncbi:MAG: hypothetical protein CMM05_03010 [Rhodopirellula sp.]|nr:hypothetical protein [Rhodopirellula sp.]
MVGRLGFKLADCDTIELRRFFARFPVIYRVFYSGFELFVHTNHNFQRPSPCLPCEADDRRMHARFIDQLECELRCWTVIDARKRLDYAQFCSRIRGFEAESCATAPSGGQR